MQAYNLNLLFSISTGEYLSDVKVGITDSTGNRVLDTVSKGPKLFAKLKPGRYGVTAERRGDVIHKSAMVGNKRMTTLSFTWPAEQENSDKAGSWQAKRLPGTVTDQQRKGRPGTKAERRRLPTSLLANLNT